MRRSLDSFRGEAPRLAPHRLPDNAAQEAINASLLTGDLRAFKQFASTQVLSTVRYYVRDTFTSTGDMATHDGEVGADWTLNAGGPLSAFDLTGSGALRCTENVIASGWFNASGELADATSDFYIETSLRFLDLTAELSGVKVFAWTAAGGFGVQANIVANDGGDDYITVDLTPTGISSFSDTVVQNFAVDTTYTVRLELTNDRKTVTLKLDGATISTGTVTGTFPDPVVLGFIFNPGDANIAAANNLEVLNFEVGSLSSGAIQTIYLLNDAWLSWAEDVDVARGVIDGDTTYRTYLTGPDLYSEPRFTNYALATTGSEPYPVTTRPLGVPAPESVPTLTLGVDSSATTFSVDVLDEGDVLETKWTASSPRGNSAVTQSATEGNPAPSYRLAYDEIHNQGEQPYAYRNFGIGSASVVEASVDVNFTDDTGSRDATFIVQADANGVGPGVHLAGGQLQLIMASAWSPYGAATLAATSAATGGSIWYTLTLRIVTNSDNTQTMTAAMYQGSGLIAEVTATNSYTAGDYAGIASASPDDSGSTFSTHYDNVHVRASGSTGYVPANVATSYVYTFVNDLGEESAPSNPSATVVRPDGVSVTVTTPVALPSGVSSEYGVATKRIYRATSGNTGTEFLFVAEVALSTADYVDVLTDAELGDALETDDWDLPPTDLEDIQALPNGVMAGFSKNRLCLSAQNRPHAWPVGNRLLTDTDIVGIGAIDTTVVIGTQSFLYWATGNDPAAYSMAKSEVPYACVSKRSFAYLTGIGVVFAGPDGLMATAGVGQVRNLTDGVFTRDQWQALNPTSIRGVAHNDIYWMHWEAGSQRGCYAIDMKPTGFGVVQMAFHATAAHVDPIEDKMYLVLDANDEPDDPSLPVRANPPAVDGETIFEFEGDPANRMTYRYRSKLWQLEHPAWFSVAQVDAEDFDNLLVRVYGDGVQVDEFAITDATEFTLTETDAYRQVEFELLGTSPCQVVQVAEGVDEIT